MTYFWKFGDLKNLLMTIKINYDTTVTSLIAYYFSSVTGLTM